MKIADAVALAALAGLQAVCPPLDTLASASWHYSPAERRVGLHERLGAKQDGTQGWGGRTGVPQYPRNHYTNNEI